MVLLKVCVFELTVGTMMFVRGVLRWLWKLVIVWTCSIQVGDWFAYIYYLYMPVLLIEQSHGFRVTILCMFGSLCFVSEMFECIV